MPGPRAFFILMLPLLLAGCSYHFQGAHNPLKGLGIQKIYVTNFRNHTYRPGIEQLFTTAMIREITRSRSFEVVNSDKEADAILTGVVTAAESTPGATKNFSLSLPEAPAFRRSVDIANEFNTSVACAIEVVDRRGRRLFAQSVSGNKVHPGMAQRGDEGATSPLVNESEQRLAVQFLATQMMASVYQRMIDTF